MEQITRIIAGYYDINYYSLFTEKKTRDLVKARALVMHFTRKIYKNKSLTTIGLFFNRDHTTVIHSLKAVKNDLDINRQFQGEFEDIKRRLKQAGILRGSKKENKEMCYSSTFEVNGFYSKR